MTKGFIQKKALTLMVHFLSYNTKNNQGKNIASF